VHDGFVSVGAVRAYRIEPEFFPLGHNMLLEPGWGDVAKRIHEWLEARDLALRAG
jgi:hypothetical protein